jgi:hypothetical protein
MTQPAGPGGRALRTESGIPRVSRVRVLPQATAMADARMQRVRVVVSFVGAPPVDRMERASGVSEVGVDGPVVSCLVCGSFQSFLEALRGHEVITLTSMAFGRGAGEPSSEESDQ